MSGHNDRLLGVSRGCTDDRSPRSTVGREADMIRCEADVPGVGSAEFQTGTRPRADRQEIRSGNFGVTRHGPENRARAVSRTWSISGSPWAAGGRPRRACRASRSARSRCACARRSWSSSSPRHRYIRRMSSRISLGAGGRPGLPRLDFQVQNARNPFRCQPMTVSGLTITSASRQRGQRRERMTQNKRSSVRSHGRRLSRFRIATCWRRARFSRCSDARLRKVSRSVATRIMMVVCMPTTVAGGGRKCYDFCGRWGFDEAQHQDPAEVRRHPRFRS